MLVRTFVSMLRSICSSLFLLAGLTLALTLSTGAAWAATWQVNTLADVTDGACNDGSCSLRDALQLAASGDEITFAPALAGQTILLTGELYTFGKQLTITSAVPITISGNLAHRVFRIGPAGVVTLNGLGISNGASAAENGGGIRVDAGGQLTVNACRIIGNQAMSGGGIFNQGAVTITHSTIADNSSTGFGGGLQSTQGVAVIEHSTLRDNRALTGGGGGINAAVGRLTLRNSTVAGNTADGPGSAVSVMSMGLPPAQTTFTMTHSTLVGADYREIVLFLSGHVWLYNSIVANQGEPTQWDCGLLEGAILANEGNLIQDGSCSAAYQGDPRLGPLADNGGATWTRLLGFGSPALDNAAPAYCLPTDQRGQPRPAGAGCDIGAVEMGELASAKVFLPLIVRGSVTTHNGLLHRR
jgi:CSLREA domain-containing protein